MEQTLTAECASRADVFLAAELALTRSHVQKLFRGGVLLNGKPCTKAGTALRAGDVLTVSLPQAQPCVAEAEEIPLNIVYEDDDVLVINKPRGMVVHPAAGNERGTLVNAVLFHCGEHLSAINGVIRPGIVHRIDKDTTGLLVVAKNNEAHLALAAQLEDRSLSRTYRALVNGKIKEESGTVCAPIARSPRDRKQMAVMPDGREATTDFSVTERFGDRYTLVQCKLRTGRTHQIRVHMKYIGHSVVGDHVYGLKKEEFSLSGQLLHAGEIGFLHPRTGAHMTFSAPLPDDFQHILDILRKKYPNEEGTVC